MTETKIGTGKPGPGRKPLAIPNVAVNVRLSPDLREEFARAGGSKWLAGVLLKMKEAREAQHG